MIPKLLLTFFLALVPTGVLWAQTPAPETQEKPACYLQILGGIQPNPVDFLIDGKLVFPEAAAGQRITGIPLSSTKGEVTVRDKVFGKDLVIPFNFKANTQNTLLIAGSFTPEKITDETKSEPIAFLLGENSMPADPRRVSISILNGSKSDSVSVAEKGGNPIKINPLQSATMSNLSTELVLQASFGGSQRNLYLGQEGSVRNLALIFFPNGETVGFKAMVCQVPESPSE